MSKLSLKSALLTLGAIALPVFIWLFWSWTHTPLTLSTLTNPYQEAGTQVRQDLATLAPQAIIEEGEAYTITDTTSDGIDISFANEAEATLIEGESEDKTPLTLSFPKDYSQPIEVKLDDKRTITITDLGGKSDYQSSTLSGETSPDTLSAVEGSPQLKQGLFERILSLRHPMSKFLTLNAEPSTLSKSYLRYRSEDGRKELLYAYQKDQATGEKKLKHWTLYQEGNGLEQESYQIENAKLKITEEGRAEVFYYGEQDLKNDQAATEVDSNLLERAQRTLAKEMGDDLIRGQTPDITIPKPYYIDKEGNKHDAEWKWHEETKTLSVSFTPESYPVALDPTLSFTAPGVSNSGSVITGEAASSSFGYAMTAGDFNADGKTDLAVGAYNYSSGTGAAYIFYNDGSISTTAVAADVIIVGEATGNYFGESLASGDWNADGKTDLAVSSTYYSSQAGRAYIFYNGSIITENASGADIIITGEVASNSFGVSLVAGDWNTDGKTDLAVGAYTYSTNAGRAYIFYNGSIVSEAASGADIIISGEASSLLGSSLTSGDWNADGKTDLAVGAQGYSSFAGRTYIFYNGSIITEAATGADIIITGEATSYFGISLASGDFNTDGKTDLAVSAYNYSTSTGRTYIFYNGSIITEAATGADVIITGETTGNRFGRSLASGDWNADGKTDLAVGADGNSSSAGRVYIFYNDGSIPTTAATADVIISGERTSNYFGYSLASGDFNADGKIDLAVGAYGYASNRGRAYIFYSQNGQVNTNQAITGETTSNDFGASLATGDLNADGRIDLVVGARNYDTGSSNVGRVYVFYNDGSYATGGASADAIITGEAAGNLFGEALATGDFNADGKIDLTVGADNYSSGTGRSYIFYNGSIITEAASGADIIITGEATSSFGYSLTSGDLNADGKTDLVVGAYNYSTITGRAYIFYNGSIITEAATGADVIITGETTVNAFGASLASGDWNADGKTDLAVGAYLYSSLAGRAYIFYNGSIITEAATGADVILTGEASSTFGISFTVGDYNADGKTDLAVGAYGYSSSAGRAYIFYNGSIITENASGADIIITGEASSNFGWSLASGDFNVDGRTDLAVGASAITTNTGKVYFFYNDGSIPTTAATADVTITGETTGNYFGYAMTAGDMNGDGRTDLVVEALGHSTSTGKIYVYETRENFAWEIQEQFGGTSRTGANGTGQELQITGETGSQFGTAMTTGDFNADGKTDLAVGAQSYSTNTGRVYLFYGDGSLTVGASSADVILTGEATNNYFGRSLAVGDYNADGKIDLAVGVYGYSINVGRAYIFYNGSIVSENASGADIIITGEASSYFGWALASGDYNADGKTDLAVGANGYSTNTGRTYIFYSGSIITENASGADVIITGEATESYFGIFITSGDYNADGRTDLAVGANGYSSNAGRAYLFYNDGAIPTTAAAADIIITGEAADNYFGRSLASGDYNADGRTDLAVGANGYSSNKGKVYIYTFNDPIITGEVADDSFGYSLASGDWNADGEIDLAVGAYGYSSSTGRVYLFYNGAIITEAATGADVIITGEASSYFGHAITAGDFNADGETDLAVSAYVYSFSTGRAYLFYNDGSYPSTAATADIILTGEASSSFGSSLASGDYNADGETDLAVGASTHSSATGRAYLFYSGSIITEDATGADIVLTGETNSAFGTSLASGDWNADGKIDLGAGASEYSSATGRAYLFYNGSIITEDATGADIIITGEEVFGGSLASGDWNADGKTDLAVGAAGYSSSTGRAYLFYNGAIITEAATGADIILTGEATDNYFGSSFVAGDWNLDGKTDLAVSAPGYSSDSGRTYVFYSGSIVSEAATGADVILTGEASSFFGSSLASGDYNTDGKTDLAIGATGYSSYTGRVYLYTMEVSAPPILEDVSAKVRGTVKTRGTLKLR